MEGVENTARSRVLIIGCTGYIGRLMARASLELGHPTYLLVRPDLTHDIRRVEVILGFKQLGAKLLEGSVDDHPSLLAALKQVDVVISTIAESRLLSQLKLVEAIKEAGNIKRFLPSEFGLDPDRMLHALKPGCGIFEAKRAIRRAVEAAGIPYTYVSANCFAGYFLSGLAQFGQFMPPKGKAEIYGDGTTKVVWSVESDVGLYSLSTVDDHRAVNKTIYIRSPGNILSQLEVVELWEKLSEQRLERRHISEQDFLKQLEGPPSPVTESLSIFYHVFYTGDCYNFTIDEDVSAAHLYPHINHTSAESYLTRFLCSSIGGGGPRRNPVGLKPVITKKKFRPRYVDRTPVAHCCHEDVFPLCICVREHGPDHIHSTWPLNAFTDGSYIHHSKLTTKHKAGYAVFLGRNNDLAKNVRSDSKMCYRLNPESPSEIRIDLSEHKMSSMIVELLAILEAIVHVQSSWCHPSVYVYTDSLQSLVLLRRFLRDPHSLWRHALREFLVAIVAAARHSKVRIHLLKVKAHARIHGNEAADRLAYAAATAPTPPSGGFYPGVGSFVPAGWSADGVVPPSWSAYSGVSSPGIGAFEGKGGENRNCRFAFGEASVDGDGTLSCETADAAARFFQERRNGEATGLSYSSTGGRTETAKDCGKQVDVACRTSSSCKEFTSGGRNAAETTVERAAAGGSGSAERRPERETASFSASGETGLASSTMEQLLMAFRGTPLENRYAAEKRVDSTSVNAPARGNDPAKDFSSLEMGTPHNAGSAENKSGYPSTKPRPAFASATTTLEAASAAEKTPASETQATAGGATDADGLRFQQLLKMALSGTGILAGKELNAEQLVNRTCTGSPDSFTSPQQQRLKELAEKSGNDAEPIYISDDEMIYISDDDDGDSLFVSDDGINFVEVIILDDDGDKEVMDADNSRISSSSSNTDPALPHTLKDHPAACFPGPVNLQEKFSLHQSDEDYIPLGESMDLDVDDDELEWSPGSETFLLHQIKASVRLRS